MFVVAALFAFQPIAQTKELTKAVFNNKVVQGVLAYAGGYYGNQAINEQLSKYIKQHPYTDKVSDAKIIAPINDKLKDWTEDLNKKFLIGTFAAWLAYKGTISVLSQYILTNSWDAGRAINTVLNEAPNASNFSRNKIAMILIQGFTGALRTGLPMFINKYYNTELSPKNPFYQMLVNCTVRGFTNNACHSAFTSNDSFRSEWTKDGIFDYALMKSDKKLFESVADATDFFVNLYRFGAFDSITGWFTKKEEIKEIIN